ncbi:MAG: hypothetical protein ACU84J_14415, partial [Gammaproteobacteria bacterium]
MSIQIRGIELRIFNMKTRLPFRYGIATMTALPHLFVKADVEVDGQRLVSVAAEHLLPKWFTKYPASPYRDDVGAMLEVVRAACRHAI